MKNDYLLKLRKEIEEKRVYLNKLLAEKDELINEINNSKSQQDIQKLKGMLQISVAKFQKLDAEVSRLLSKIKNIQNI